MSVVIMRGISGSGKSTIVKDLFYWHNVLSTDALREEMYGAMDVPPSASGSMWAEFHKRLEHRCKYHMPTVVDATNLSGKVLKPIMDIIRKYAADFIITSITPDIEASKKVMALRRSGVLFGMNVPDDRIDVQLRSMENNNKNMRCTYKGKFFEGTAAECREVAKKYIDNLNVHHIDGPAFIIGDLHGKINKLAMMLESIPANAKIFSVGDLIDRGEDSVGAVKMLTEDPRFGGYALGNHDINFIHEHMGLMDCRSKDRKATHEVVRKISPQKRDKFLDQLKLGRAYLILRSEGHRDALLTHTGLSSFDPLRANIMHTVHDRFNNKDDNPHALADRFIQVHGHRSWEYNGDFYGDVVNVDSGCYDTGVLTAFDPFTREVIHV